MKVLTVWLTPFYTGDVAEMRAEGSAEISRWRQPSGFAPAGAADFPTPLPGRVRLGMVSGGLRHRLISGSPPGWAIGLATI